MYGVDVSNNVIHVTVTMTSAACPVTDVIIEDIENELDQTVPTEILIQVELVWEPPWNTDRMSREAKEFMGW